MILISFITVFVPLLCCHSLWSFFEMFVFIFLLLLLLLLSLFLLVFISCRNFISSNKHATATTAVIEQRVCRFY